MSTVDWRGAFAGKLEMGKSSALLLVDPVKAYLDEGSPLYLESGKAAQDRMAELAALFRARGHPVIWTGVHYQPDGSDGGYFFKKVPALQLFTGQAPLGAFPDGLTPEDGEPVFIKQYPSAFFGTSLDKWLNERGIDTLFIGGYSTSGCVRASALDTLQYGFIPFVVSDACADRDDELQSQNLRDLGAKYAEIVVADEVEALLG